MKEFLRQLQELVQQTEISQKSFYMLRISELMKRLEDPQMKLAIIGNFSCGKSTFLNALLEQPLLSMSNTPTTAVPTWIDWEGRQEGIQIRVRGLDNTLLEMDEAGRQRFFRMTGTEPPAQPGPLVDYLTTTTDLLSFISQVHISFPARQGFRGFTLIDTPGVNPGDETDAGHILSTQAVLRDQADATIVLFPCYSAYTRGFSEFMEDNASHLMDDAIFIITKMDMVEDPGEQKKLIWFVRENLKKSFELEDPQVYPCSAGMALAFSTDGDPAAESWATDFSRMTEEIFDSLGQRRLHTAAKRASGLVLELMADLTGAVEERKKTLELFLENLETYSREAFRDRVNTLASNYNADAAVRKMIASQASVKQILEKAKMELCRGIQGAVTWKQLNDFLWVQGMEITRQAMEQVVTQAKAVTENYTSSWNKDLERYEKELYYSRHTYHSFLDSIHGKGYQDVPLDLPNTLRQIRTDMDRACGNARKKMHPVQSEAERIARGNWLPLNNNPISWMRDSLPEHRNFCLTTVECEMNWLGETFRSSAMEAAQCFFDTDVASIKLLAQLFKQNYTEKFLLKQPDLEDYRNSLEAQVRKQSLDLAKLRELKPMLARWTVKTETE